MTLETSLTSADTFRSEAPGAPDFRIDPDDLDEGMPAPGTPMPLADVVERMVVVSSNEATNMVVELVGRDAANAALADAGATSSSFGRKYSDLAAAAALGGSHRHHRPRSGDADVRRRHRRARRAGVDLVDDGDARPPARPPTHRRTCPTACRSARSPGGSTGSATTSPSSASRARTRWSSRSALVATRNPTPKKPSEPSAPSPSRSRRRSRSGRPSVHFPIRAASGPVSRRSAAQIGLPIDQARSKRSRFITLSHAATKSRTNLSLASSEA